MHHWKATFLNTLIASCSSIIIKLALLGAIWRGHFSLLVQFSLLFFFFLLTVFGEGRDIFHVHIIKKKQNKQKKKLLKNKTKLCWHPLAEAESGFNMNITVVRKWEADLGEVKSFFFCRFPADYDFKGLRIGSTTFSYNQVKGKGRVLHRANSAALMKCPRVLTPNLTPPLKKKNNNKNAALLIHFQWDPLWSSGELFLCGCQSRVSPELTPTQRGEPHDSTVTWMTQDLPAAQTPPTLATVSGFGVNAACYTSGRPVSDERAS